MTVHVLHAGDGYAYLTDQVASDDVKREPGQSLSDYYLAHGNPPGQWVGAGLEALGVSGEVSENQMKALFGEGLHPDADEMIAASIAAGTSAAQAHKDARLGRKFPVFKEVENDDHPVRLQAAYKAFSIEHDRAPEMGEERDELRWKTAVEILTERDEGRAPEAADVARYLSTRGSDQRKAVAGYDLVFTPVKSVSTLWALADDDARATITTVHQEAWREAFAWVQKEAGLTRVGAGGVAQIDTFGLVATAFDHLDSRTGDPNLHTHVAVSTKVQGVDGKWRSLDGRVLHLAAVAASERYNTAIETKLRQQLGVRFLPEGRKGRRPVREIAGVTKEVRTAFSQRRGQVEAAYEELLADYRRQHGREAPRAVQFKLAQQATLATREAKKATGGLRHRLPEWRATAEAVLGGRRRVDRMVRHALDGALDIPHPDERRDRRPVETLQHLASQVLSNVAGDRSTWNHFHLAAEASRVVRGSRWAELAPPETNLADVIELVSERAIASSVRLTPKEVNPAEEGMTRSDGASIYTQRGSTVYTSASVLAAEEALVTAAQSRGGLVVPQEVFEQAIAVVQEEKGRTLNRGQLNLAAQFAGAGKRVVAGIGPAGTGKTASMSAFARAVELAGGRVLGLAPSAVAAAVLGEELGVTADTLDKLVLEHQMEGESVGEKYRIDEKTVLLVDEAGMAGTPMLGELLKLAEKHGASVRLLGDPLQMASVGAGGVLRLIDKYVGAAQLEEVHRFRREDGSLNEEESLASLQVRDGDARGLDYYIDRDRVRGGTREAMLEEIYAAWQADTAAGQNAIMIASTNDVVVTLNTRARADRIAAGEVAGPVVDLHDGSQASVGDIIVTRNNDRRLRTGRTDWVRNGDLWRVTRRGRDGSLSVVHRTTNASVTLPAAYVAEWVELGYAATINRVQGMTTDTQHGLVDESSTRNQMYTANTRGKYLNRMYVVTDAVLDVDLHEQPDAARAIRETLEAALARVDEEQTALEAIEAEWERAYSLAELIPAYRDAYTRLLEPGREERYEAVVRAAAPERAEEILNDRGWPTLRDRLLQHEAAGADIEDQLRHAIARGRLDTAHSLARILHHRLGEPETTDDALNLPVWILPPPEVEHEAFGTLPVPTATSSTPSSSTPAPDGLDAVDDGTSSDVGQVEGEHVVMLDLAGIRPAEELMTSDEAPGVDAVVDVERQMAVDVSAAAWQWWTEQATAPSSWTSSYLAERRLSHLEHGWAPEGWDALVQHLREQGFHDDDLVAAGVASLTRDGRLIDKFRDRLVVPVRNSDGDVVGVSARRNPDVVDDRVPKYMNTPQTAAYDKSQLLLGWSPEAAGRVTDGATVVFVEGAMDKAAIDALGREDVVALAPCGTALTDAQLDLVREAGGDLRRRAIFAFDGDKTGQTAAQRAWVRLAPEEAAGARYLALPPGVDPGDLVERGQAELLGMVLRGASPLTEALVDQVLAAADLDRIESRVATVRNIAASLARLPESLDLDLYVVERLRGHMDPALVGDLLREARDPEETVAAELDVALVDITDGEQPASPVVVPVREADPVVGEWLRRQAQLIDDRLDALVADVEGPTPPLWASQLYRPPVGPNTLAKWRAAVRTIAAYRDEYRITGADPLGVHEPRHGEQRTAYLAAQAAVDVVTPTTPAQPPTATQEEAIAAERRRLELERLRERARNLGTPQPSPDATPGAGLPPLSGIEPDRGPSVGM